MSEVVRSNNYKKNGRRITSIDEFIKNNQWWNENTNKTRKRLTQKILNENETAGKRKASKKNNGKKI